MYQLHYYFDEIHLNSISHTILVIVRGLCTWTLPLGSFARDKRLEETRDQWHSSGHVTFGVDHALSGAWDVDPHTRLLSLFPLWNGCEYSALSTLGISMDILDGILVLANQSSILNSDWEI